MSATERELGDSDGYRVTIVHRHWPLNAGSRLPWRRVSGVVRIGCRLYRARTAPRAVTQQMWSQATNTKLESAPLPKVTHQIWTRHKAAPTYSSSSKRRTHTAWSSNRPAPSAPSARRHRHNGSLNGICRVASREQMCASDGPREPENHLLSCGGPRLPGSFGLLSPPPYY